MRKSTKVYFSGHIAGMSGQERLFRSRYFSLAKKYAKKFIIMQGKGIPWHKFKEEKP